MSFLAWLVAVAGVASLCIIAVSVYHHHANAGSLGSTIPVHFDLNGVPDHYRSAGSFWIYPVLSILLGLCSVGVACAVAYIPITPALLFLFSSLTCSLLVLRCQSYAVWISQGVCERIPPRELYAYLGVVLGCSILGVIFLLLAM